jgi:hypothetical protein
MWGIASLTEELLACQEEFCFMELVRFFIYVQVPLNVHMGYCMESGTVQDLGCHGGITKGSVHILILHCVTGQIIPMFQKVIIPTLHHELCASHRV